MDPTKMVRKTNNEMNEWNGYRMQLANGGSSGGGGSHGWAGGVASKRERLCARIKRHSHDCRWLLLTIESNLISFNFLCRFGLRDFVSTFRRSICGAFLYFSISLCLFVVFLCWFNAIVTQFGTYLLCATWLVRTPRYCWPLPFDWKFSLGFVTGWPMAWEMIETNGATALRALHSPEMHRESDEIHQSRCPANEREREMERKRKNKFGCKFIASRIHTCGCCCWERKHQSRVYGILHMVIVKWIFYCCFYELARVEWKHLEIVHSSPDLTQSISLWRSLFVARYMCHVPMCHYYLLLSLFVATFFVVNVVCSAVPCCIGTHIYLLWKKIWQANWLRIAHNFDYFLLHFSHLPSINQQLCLIIVYTHYALAHTHTRHRRSIR